LCKPSAEEGKIQAPARTWDAGSIA